MQPIPRLATSIMPRQIVVGLFAILAWNTPTLLGQDASYPPPKSSPPKIEKQMLVLPESVVQTQWPNTLKLVNAPQNIALLNPGQCIRVGIYSTGDKHDDFLGKTKLSYRVHFSGHVDSQASAPLAQVKQIKAEGGDFVNGALGAAGIKLPSTLRTMASLGVSADHWCVPSGVGDGNATIEAEAESPRGRQAMSPTTIQVQSFETGSKKSFKDIDELGAFSEAYYRQPNPVRLLPALQFIVASQTQQAGNGQAEIFSAFLSAALRSDPTAALEFLGRIGAQPPLTRAFGLLCLRSAGYNIDSVLNTLSADQRQKFNSLQPLQNPFDLTPTQALFQHLDMLWAVFSATGQFKPIETISSALGWRADYEAFDKLRNTPNHSSTPTPSIVRGIVYTAAGWSLRSFQKRDPLVADYIEFLRASPKTSGAVKSELARLSSNPAFSRPGGR